MRQLSVKAKLIIQTVITISFIIIIGAVGIYIFSVSSRNIKILVSNKLPSTRGLALIDMNHEGIKSATLQAILAKIKNDKKYYEKAKQDIKNLNKSVNDLFNQITNLENDKKIHSEVTVVREEFKKYLEISGIIISELDNGQLEQAQEKLQELNSEFDLLEERLEAFGNSYEKRNQDYFLDIEKELKVFDIILWSIIAAGVILSILISRAIINTILVSLNSITDSISKNSMNIGLSISQLSLSSEQLSSAVTEESSALQQTAASIEEISAMGQKASENANNTSKSAIEIREKALHGQTVMKDLISAIEEISKSNNSVNHEVKESNNRINEILSVIQEIGNKTKVINDIVFQTKLLSFNASVEAARAGENGKGFAVVAEEVGKLAQMSGNAAKEITTLLDSSLDRVEKIAEESKTKIDQIMTESQAKVSKGSDVAKNFEFVLNEIVDDTQNSSEMIKEISNAANEQANGVDEISKAINQLNQATQVNAMAAETTSAAAEGLKEQSNDLRSVASNLKAMVDGRISVPRFIWRDEYSLHVDDMDGEHKILIQKINTLAEQIEFANGGTNKKVIEAYSDLTNYTVEHFTNEEKFMAAMGYSQLSGHKEIHKKLVNTVLEFKEKVEKHSYDPMELMNFLNDWLVSHILNIDMKYANQYNTKNKT